MHLFAHRKGDEEDSAAADLSDALPACRRRRARVCEVVARFIVSLVCPPFMAHKRDERGGENGRTDARMREEERSNWVRERETSEAGRLAKENQCL